VSYAPVVTFASAPERAKTMSVVAQLFSTVAGHARCRLAIPRRGQVELCGRRLRARHHEIVTEVVAPDWPSFVRKSALRADSFLARLSDTEFDEGMAALRADRANINPAEAVTEEIDWFVFKKRAEPAARDLVPSARNAGAC